MQQTQSPKAGERTHKPDCNRITGNRIHLCSCDAPTKPMPRRHESGEYLAPNKTVKIYKPDTHPIDKMVRLYCTQFATSWKLQIRGPLSIGCNGTQEGKSSVIAGADLSLEQMISLRDALGESIFEAEAAIFKAEAINNT